MRERTFGADEIRQLRDRLADGLALAHEKGVIHRDISPDNVILPGGQVTQAKIIDFGISKLADPETKTIIGSDFAGKYSYVSPEQLGMFGGQVDGRSDIYSLGLVLVAAAQGEPLDMGQSPISVIEARRSVPDLSRVPEAVRADLAAMLEPDPADRPQSMRALVGAAARQGTRPAKATTGSERPAAGGRTRLVPVVATLAVVALVAGGGWYWYEFIRTTDEAAVADSGQQPSGSTTSTIATPGESSTQSQVAPPVVVDQTAATPPTADATDATQIPPAAASTDTAAVAADSGQADATGADAADESPPIVDTSSTSTDVSATAPTNESPSAATAPDGGQPADTQVVLLPQALDLDRLRDDANRAVQGLSCAGIQIDAAASGDITASGYAGTEADRDKVARLLQGVPNVGRIENAVAVMPWPL
ncbi:MAG: protein kinase, partial [Chloroflexi bacterium]|nr:protein kinase [Chloroflexota bacterium]